MTASKARKQRRFIQRASEAGMPIDSVYRYERPAMIEEPSQLNRYRQYYRYIAYSEAMTRINWINLPEQVDSRFLELSLFLYGQASISHLKGEYLAQMAMNGDLYDKQQNYKSWLAVSAMGDVAENQTDKNAVLVYDNMLRTPPIELLNPLIEDAAQAMTTASSNLIQQRYAVFFEAGKNNMSEAKKLSKMLGMGEVGAVGVKDVIDNNLSVKTINPDVSDVTATAFSAKKEYLNEIHAFLGTDYIPHEKKERLVSDEAQASLDKVMRQREFFLKPRRKAAEQMNNLYGWNVSVEWALGKQAVKDNQGGVNDSTEE